MNIAFWCVLISGLLPYAGTAAAKWGFRSFDNNNPRQWLSKQTGFRARGNAAQANSFEVFPLFAAAVIIASMLRAPQSSLDSLAVGFVLSRVAFLVCYLTDRASLRTLFFTIAMVCVVAIFVVAARAGA